MQRLSLLHFRASLGGQHSPSKRVLMQPAHSAAKPATTLPCRSAAPITVRSIVPPTSGHGGRSPVSTPSRSRGSFGNTRA